jgi:hypothetical protein
MHPAAVGERLALDPAQDLAAFVVDSEPPGSGVEADRVQMNQEVADEQSVRARRPANRVANTDDRVVGRASGEFQLRISRG